MHELYEGIQLNEEQTEWICRALLDLAAVDGVHESEIALIADFYAQGSEGGDLDALRAKGFDLAEGAKVILAGGEKVVEAFLISSYLLVYADGEHSDEERSRVSDFASALGTSTDKLESLHLKARLYLLQMLAQNLRNKAALQQVGAELGLDSSDIAAVLEK